MALQPANHFVVAGKGISALVDPAGLAGQPVITLEVDGCAVEGASLTQSPIGFEVSGMVSATPDLQTIHVRMVLPEVNLEEEAATFVGFAVLVTSRTSIGGPALVEGPIHLYELRPVAGTAAAVDF